MDTRRIAQLAQVMSRHELTEISIENADLKVTLKRGRLAEAAVGPMLAAPLAAQAPAVVAAGAGAANAAGPAATCIVSPIVGTFYVAPSPDAPPFVSPGDKVGPESVVCIVEAMKVMNEIKAELSGVIRRILVENGTPVEYGQPLFEIETH
jgi:acetyl-CoA carboxylase biotin carboxyl carrier protein